LWAFQFCFTRSLQVTVSVDTVLLRFGIAKNVLKDWQIHRSAIYNSIRVGLILKDQPNTKVFHRSSKRGRSSRPQGYVPKFVKPGRLPVLQFVGHRQSTIGSGSTAHFPTDHNALDTVMKLIVSTSGDANPDESSRTRTFCFFHRSSDGGPPAPVETGKAAGLVINRVVQDFADGLFGPSIDALTEKVNKVLNSFNGYGEMQVGLKNSHLLTSCFLTEMLDQQFVDQLSVVHRSLLSGPRRSTPKADRPGKGLVVQGVTANRHNHAVRLLPVEIAIKLKALALKLNSVPVFFRPKKSKLKEWSVTVSGLFELFPESHKGIENGQADTNSETLPQFRAIIEQNSIATGQNLSPIRVWPLYRNRIVNVLGAKVGRSQANSSVVGLQQDRITQNWQGTIGLGLRYGRYNLFHGSGRQDFSLLFNLPNLLLGDYRKVLSVNTTRPHVEKNMAVRSYGRTVLFKIDTLQGRTGIVFACRLHYGKVSLCVDHRFTSLNKAPHQRGAARAADETPAGSRFLLQGLSGACRLPGLVSLGGLPLLHLLSRDPNIDNSPEQVKVFYRFLLIPVNDLHDRKTTEPQPIER